MDRMQQGPWIGYAVGGAIFLLVFAFRMRRMMQSRPFRLQYIWVLPLIFSGMTVLALFARPPLGVEWLWVAASFAVGAALGWVRAMTIRLAVEPGSGQVTAQGSPLAMVLILALFVVRFGLRSLLMSDANALGLRIAVVDSAFLAMACGLFIARAVEMGLRARKLIAPSPANLPVA